MTRGVDNNLSGMRFGHLVAQHRNGSDAQHNALWSCKCDCGNVVDIRGAFLKKGQEYCSKQCRLYVGAMRENITGQKFGRLTAVQLTCPSGKRGKTKWTFRCDCGTEVECSATNVITGSVRSCGCLGTESRIKHGKSQTLEYHRDAHRKWAKENPSKVIANAMMRTKALRQRIPAWLTDEQWDAINAFYLEAKRLTEETGIIHHVDHKFPLRGKTVSGLHVPWNLQILTRDENLRKANRLFYDVC